MVDGKLPSGDPESTHKQSPADHLRKVFYRMGLNDQVTEEKRALWPSCSPLPLIRGQEELTTFWRQSPCPWTPFACTSVLLLVSDHLGEVHQCWLPVGR